MADRTDQFYAAEGAVHGYGTQFLVGEGDSPETVEAVAGVRSVTFGETAFEDLDTTHLRSLNKHREHRAGMRDSSAITVAGIYLPAEPSHSAAGGGTGPFQNGGLPTLAEDGAFRNFIVRFPTDPVKEVQIRGYIQSFSLGEVGQDDVIPFQLVVMPSQAFDLP